MKRFSFGVLMLVLTVASVQTVHGQDKDAVREKIDTAIVEGIRLLEAKDYLGFLKAFADPEQLKKMEAQGGLEEIAKSFGERKSKPLLAAMKSIKDKKPKLSDDGNTATFDIDVEGLSKKDISFSKIGKYWYIKN